MIKLKYTLFLLLVSSSLGAASYESAAVQEMRLSLEELERKIHSQSVEISLFQERAAALEKSISAAKLDARAPTTDKNVERRLSVLEKANETLVADLKTLKAHLNENNVTISQCQNQLNKIDKQISADIISLKTSMQSMLTLLKGESKSEGSGASRSYTVKSGDSLGQIALENKTDIKTLKKLNHLNSDTIFTGQKLTLPN